MFAQGSRGTLFDDSPLRITTIRSGHYQLTHKAVMGDSCHQPLPVVPRSATLGRSRDLRA